MSARYKCADCGERRMIDNHRDLVAHSGPWFGYWRARTLASLGVVGLDAGRPEA